MALEPLVIVGAGGFGREVCWLVEEINQACPTWSVLGFLDADPEALAGLDVPGRVIGSPGTFGGWADAMAVCAIGDPVARKKVVTEANSRGARWATLIHPTAMVGTASSIGPGSILCRGAGVTVNACLGQHVHMNLHSIAGHDARLGDFCSLACHVDIAGGVVLEEGAFLGSHAVVLPKARVGAWARVGAGTVVLRHVPAERTVFGVPAKDVV